jgi:coatomer subunit zeta
VNAILILQPDGTRVLAKYFHPPHSSAASSNPYPTLKEQKPFEKGLVEKTAKSNSDIILYDNRIVVFKAESDVMLYVVGGVEENEMLLWHTLLALRDSLNILLK